MAKTAATTANDVAVRAANQYNLTELEASRIQRFADKHEVTIHVVGSKVSGKAHPLSDYDYVISGSKRVRKLAEKQLPRGVAGGANNKGIDIFDEATKPLDVSAPHRTFSPRKK